MAGLLDRITRQVINSLEPKKTAQSRPKTMSQTANRKPVAVMQVTPRVQTVKPIAPIVGPDVPVSTEPNEPLTENTKKDSALRRYLKVN